MKKTILTAVFVLFCTNVLAAIDWDITSGSESISGSDEYGTVNVFNSAELDVLGGTTNRIFGYNQSKIDITAGAMNILEAHDDSIFNLWGGSIGIISTPASTAAFNIYGTNLGISGSFVEGNWSNGNPFSIELRGENRDIVALHEIPEPVTLALLGLGGLLIRRKK